MAKNVTPAELIAKARSLADQVGSTYVSPAQALASCQEHFGDYYDLLLLEDPDFFPVQYEIITPNGEDSHALPGTFGSLVGCDRREGSRWVSLEPFMLTERNQFDTTGGIATRYRLNGETVELRPTPADGVYRAVYHAVPPTLELDTKINDVSGWTRLIVLGVAGDMHLKQGTDGSALALEKDKFLAGLLARISRRQATATKRIRDVSEERGHDDAADFWPRRGA